MKKKSPLIVSLACLLAGWACSISIGPENQDPVVSAINTIPSVPQVIPGDTVQLSVLATDADSDTLSYLWQEEQDRGLFLLPVDRESTAWQAPLVAQNCTIKVTVTDGKGGKDESRVEIIVKSFNAPYVVILQPVTGDYIPGFGNCEIRARATHVNGIQKVEFFWNGGLVETINQNLTLYTHTQEITGLTGTHTIKVKAYSVAASVDPGSTQVSINIEGASEYKR